MRQTSVAQQAHAMKMVRNVHRGCPNCFAPGEYRCETFIREGYTETQIAEMIRADPVMAAKAHFFRAGWPKVWVPMNDPKFGEAVGGRCPQCNHKRPAKPEQLSPITIFGRLF